MLHSWQAWRHWKRKHILHLFMLSHHVSCFQINQKTSHSEIKLLFRTQEKKFMICLYFLNINKNYKNHTFLNLIDEIQFQRKWIKTWILINNKCELISMIDTKYVQKQHLKIQKLKYNMILKNFNEKII